MKMVKRIAAVGCSLTMAVSMMSIGAGADNYYNLHYTSSAPSSDNVCEKWLYGVTAHNEGCLESTCYSYKISGSSVNVLSNGYRSSNHTVHCGSFPIWETGTSYWNNSNFQKGLTYDVVVDFGVNGGITNISSYTTSAKASGKYK